MQDSKIYSMNLTFRLACQKWRQVAFRLHNFWNVLIRSIVKLNFYLIIIDVIAEHPRIHASSRFHERFFVLLAAEAENKRIKEKFT